MKEDGMGGRSESNKALIRRLFEAVDGGDIDFAAGCYAPDYVDHSPSVAREQASSAALISCIFRSSTDS